MSYFLVFLVPYLIGAFSGTLLTVKIFNLEDILKKGSGNRGTTNVFRNYGKLPAVVTLIIDLGKGGLASYLSYIIEPTYGPYIGGIAVVLGHIYPIYYKFKGGKGVATSLGVLFFHLPVLALVEILVFIILNLTVKIVSIGSIIISFLSIFYGFIFHIDEIGLLIMLIVNFILILFAHRENLIRIIKKEEVKTEFLRGKK